MQGNILKMRTELARPVKYFLPVGDGEIDMNALIGRKIKMQFSGQINCISCGKITKTSYNQGFCYSCFQTAPEADESVVHPELSMAQFGISRDMEWSNRNDLTDHIVYLALTSDVKIGVTRHHQIPTRWIDQGASYAIKIAKTPNRHIAGIIETFLKKYFTDRTNWKNMLINKPEVEDILNEKNKALQLLPAELKKYSLDDNEITAIEYPLDDLPLTLKSTGFEKNLIIEGVLTGIKGQYLILDHTRALNIRKHNGYFITVTY